MEWGEKLTLRELITFSVKQWFLVALFVLWTCAWLHWHHQTGDSSTWRPQPLWQRLPFHPECTIQSLSVSQAPQSNFSYSQNYSICQIHQWLYMTEVLKDVEQYSITENCLFKNRKPPFNTVSELFSLVIESAHLTAINNFLQPHST